MSQLTTKVCVLGDFSVGKTSLVRRFAENRFDDSYLSTIGVRVSRKVMPLEGDGASISMLVWDTAGGEPFSEVVRAYYRGSRGGLLVCDLTRADTVAALAAYARDFQNVNPGCPLVMLGNKIDLAAQREASAELLAEAAAALGAPLFLCSARTGEGVNAAFQALGQAIVKERNVG